MTSTSEKSTALKANPNPSEKMGSAKVPCILYADQKASHPRTSTALRKVADEVISVSNTDECLKNLDKGKWEKVFLVVSGSLGQQIIPSIHDMKQIESIYIFCSNTSYHHEWAKDWTKIKGVHDDLSTLIANMQGIVQPCSPYPSKEPYFSPIFNKLDVSFMYTLLFKNTLLELQSKPSHENYFVKIMQHIAASSDVEESSMIHKWLEIRDKNLPVWEFVREQNLFNQLNQPLRTFNLDVLSRIGFIICDIHRHIEKVYQESRQSSARQSFTVYYCERRSAVDFKKMKKTKGGLYAFNEFLLGYRDQKLAVKQAVKNSNESDDVMITFEMKIDRRVDSVRFIRNEIENGESPILFSTHTVFRLENIDEIAGNSAKAQMRLTNTRDEGQLILMNQYFGNEDVQYPAWYRIVKLLIKLDRLDTAEEFCKRMMNGPRMSELDESRCYDQLGMIKTRKEEYAEALEYHEKALGILSKIKPPNNVELANVHNNIGEVEQRKKDFTKAMTTHKNARNLLEKNSVAGATSVLAVTYEHLGRVQAQLKNFDEARNWYEKSLKTRNNCFPSNHPDFITIYSELGRLYEQQGNYSEAVASYKKASRIRTKSLPAYQFQ